MKSHILAATCFTLLFAAAGASAQDNQHNAPNAPALPRPRLAPQGGAAMGGPRMRDNGPRLGVTVESTPDGLKVASVDEGSLAAAAGLKPGDVLQRIGTQRVHDVDEVAVALHGYAPGAEVEVTVVRPGEGLVTLKGTLPAPKAEDQPRLPATDGVKGGFLGVQMKSEPADGGVGVAGVVPDSAAWFAGLQEGDMLTSLDGKSLASPEDLAGAVAGKEPGTFVELKFKRDGAEQAAKVRLGRRAPMGLLGGMGPGGRGLRLRLTPDGQMAPFGGNAADDDGDLDNDFQGMAMPDLQQFLQGMQGMDGLGGAMHDLHGALMDGGAHSVQVRIENDHMTITKDGVTQEYQRDAHGQWIRQEDKAPADATPHGA
jgi:membrane-associated protease RseP (regulator of RpoE activity)